MVTDLWLNFDEIFRSQTCRWLLEKLTFFIWFYKCLFQKSFTTPVTLFLGYYAVNACILLPEPTDFNSQSQTQPPEVLLQKNVLKKCSKFTEKHPCRSAISCNFGMGVLQ